MRRFAIFSAALLVLIIIGSLPGKGATKVKSACVCLPSRAALLVRSITNVAAVTTTHTQAQR
jgi:hypothetical protein